MRLPKQIMLFIGLFIFLQTANSQTSYTWNGSLSASWSTPGNWTPSGAPGPVDNVTIVTGSNTCQLGANATIANIKVTSGTLDLGGFTLTAAGATATFTSGTVQNGVMKVSGATSTSFGNGPMTINCKVNINSASVTLKNTTFQNAVTITKTGSNNDGSGGGNVFNGPATFNNPGSGYLLLANGSPDVFNAAATFNNTGSSQIYVAYNSSNNIFNGVTTFNNAPVANTQIYVSQISAGTLFNDSIVVTSTAGQGVVFGGNVVASSTLAAGKVITVGVGGFTAGTLYLRQFNQLGATPQNITLTGAGNLTFGPSSSFAGDVTAVSPTLYLNGCNFIGASNFTKNGSTGDWSTGGNIFNGVSSFTNSGTSYFLLGSNNPDTWNSDVTFTDNGSERLLPCWSSVGNQFNGDIYVNTSGGAQGIQFCGGNNTATVTLAAGKTIRPGTTGLTAGYLYLKQFTQAGTADIALAATGTASLYLGPNSNFGGAFTATAPDIWAQGAVYNGPAVFTKTGGNSNHNNQNQNIFNASCTINQQSNTGYFMLGYNSNDQFNDTIMVTSTGTGGINLGWQSGTGTPTLAAGKTVMVGAAGFSAGYLNLYTFTQLGNEPMDLSFSGTNTYLRFSRASVIGGKLTTNTPDIFFNGCTFNGTVNSTKTGAGNDYSSGGNTFQDSTTLNNPTTGLLIMGNGNADTCNSKLILNSTGGSYIGMAWSSAGNIFNGDITVTSTNSSTGIQFCSNSASTATLSAGSTILVGGGGFSSGTLYLRQFTQLGNAAINLNLTGATTLLQVGPFSAIGGTLTAVSPRILLNGAVYGDSVNVTKTGVTGEWSNGGNTFGSTLTINQQGGGYFGMANGAPDIYNGDVYANNNSTERIIFGNNPAGNQFNGNIILTQIGSSQGIAFGWSSNTNETQAAGKTISIGTAGFNVGYLQFMRFTQLGNTPVNLPLTGTASLAFGPSSVIGGDLSSTSATLLFNGCTFNGTANCTKYGTTNDWGTGNNIFNGVATMTNAGAGYLLFGGTNRDQFNTDVTFNNTGSSNMYVAYNTANNIFGGVTRFNNTPTANTQIYVSPNGAGTLFNDSIVVTSTNGQGVIFCNGNATATATLAAGKTISIGAGGFSSGTLLLRQFTQVGPTAQTLLLTGTANLTYGPSSSFGGDMTGTSPTVFLNGCNFDGVTNITKTGTTGDYSGGGNTFNGVSNITNSGSSFFLLGNSNPDTWNSDVTFTSNGSERMLPAWATPGNLFNGDIYVNTAGTAQGIQFCGGNNTATATVAVGKTIKVGTIGLKSGYLILKQFTQLGNAPVNLTMASTAGTLQYGPLSTLGGDVTSTSPGLLFNGCTFNGAATCTKIGASNDGSAGNNIFNGVANMTNTGSGYLMFANGNRDQFNTNATFNNLGSSQMYVAYNSPNNVFGGVTTFNNSPATNTGISVSQYSAGTIFSDSIVMTSTNGQGVQFCTGNGAATATLAAGKCLAIGSAGFSAGLLWLRQFTQLGTTPSSLTLTGTGNLTFGPSSAIGGNITTVSPTLLFSGCNFGGTVVSTKNGSNSDASPGNNTFNGAFTITNTGAGYFMMGNGNPDVWQSTATFNNLSPGSHMYTAYNSTGNLFNGDVVYNNQPGATGLWIYPNNNGINTQFNGNISVNNVNGAGVYFGSGSGSATLATGRAISVGSGGFTTGGLIFRNFRQTGAGTPQTLTSTGSSYIQYGVNASFDGTVTSTSPGLLFNGCTFNGTVFCTKTGTSNDQSAGNNIFNASSTFTNNGTGYLMMATNTADAYNNNVIFVQNAAGAILPNYNTSCNYAANLTVTSPSAAAIVFGSNTGTANLTGSSLQTINGGSGSTPPPVFTRLVVANTGGGVTLNNISINVSKNLALTSGLLNTSTSYILTMLNGSTTAPGNALSTTYVNGPMRYQKSSSGATTMNFPIGASPDCRPAVLVVSHTNGTLYTYTAQVFDASARALGWTLPPTVDHVSNFHYWTIDRTNAAGTNVPKTDLSGNQAITLFYGSNDLVLDGGKLTVCKNTYTAMTAWIDIGGAGGPAPNGSNLTGSVSSTNTPTVFNSFSTFTIGNMIGGMNVLPTQLLFFHAKPNNNLVDLTWATATESNSKEFTVERSRDGANFGTLQKVSTKAINGSSNTVLNYATQDLDPYTGTSFYRLKQTDLDGSYKYSDIVTVNFDKRSLITVYPNPTRGTVYIRGIDVNQTSVRVEWYDLSGKVIAQEVVPAAYGAAQLNPHFNNGVYVLKVISSDGSFKIQNLIILK